MRGINGLSIGLCCFAFLLGTMSRSRPFSYPGLRQEEETQYSGSEIAGRLRIIFEEPLASYHLSLISYLSSVNYTQNPDAESEVLDILGVETERLNQEKDFCKSFHVGLKDLVYIWLRFSKIGGTTFQSYLSNFSSHYGLVKEGCDYFSNHGTGPTRLRDFESCQPVVDEVWSRKIDLVYGHQAFGNHRIFPNREIVYLVLSRDIADLQFSYWNYNSRKNGLNITMDQFVATMPTNTLTCYTCGPWRKEPYHGNVCSRGDNLTLAVAKYNLARVDYISGWFVDYFTATKKVLVGKLWDGFSSMDQEKKIMPGNITYKSVLSDDMRLALNQHHALDAELNRFLMESFNKQLECLPLQNHTEDNNKTV